MIYGFEVERLDRLLQSDMDAVRYCINDELVSQMKVLLPAGFYSVNLEVDTELFDDCMSDIQYKVYKLENDNVVVDEEEFERLYLKYWREMVTYPDEIQFYKKSSKSPHTLVVEDDAEYDVDDIIKRIKKAYDDARFSAEEHWVDVIWDRLDDEDEKNEIYNDLTKNCNNE